MKNSLYIRIIRHGRVFDQQGLDGVSVGGGGIVAPSLVRATSNTMISISRFRKRLSRSYLKPNDAFDQSHETETRGIEVPSAGVEK